LKNSMNRLIIRSAAMALVGVAMLVTSSCRDSSPRTSTVPSDTYAYPHLVVLSPGMAVILRDLKRSDTIVGRHAFDMVTDPRVPVAGSQSELDYEVLLRVRPTHVLLESGAKDVPPRLSELSRAHGWRIESLPALRLDDIRRQITRLDEISGRLDPGEASPEGAALLKSFDETMSTRPGLRERLGRAMPLASTSPIGILGPGSFHAEMLAALGATPIPESGSAFIHADVEDVLKADPDSLVLFLPANQDLEMHKLLGALAGQPLRAIKEGRVLVIRDPLCHSPSTALIPIAHEIGERTESWITIEAASRGIRLDDAMPGQTP